MKLFKCHAVIPRMRGRRAFLVRTYAVSANTPLEAQARIRGHERRVEFVTVPAEMVAGLMVTDEQQINEREFDDLRAACRWNEGLLRSGTD
jgi:hypothetical protein